MITRYNLHPVSLEFIPDEAGVWMKAEDVQAFFSERGVFTEVGLAAPTTLVVADASQDQPADPAPAGAPVDPAPVGAVDPTPLV